MRDTLDANISTCVKEVLQLGAHEWHNICTGSVHIVSWTALEWVMAVFFGVVMLSYGIMVFCMAISLIFERPWR